MIVASICGPDCGGRLFVHVLGAFALFGSVLAITILAFIALRQGPELAGLLRRIAFWTALAVSVPTWIVMYFGGYWVLDHEGLDDKTPGWAEGGIAIAHIGAALVLLLLLLSWLSSRRPRFFGGALAAAAAIDVVLLGAAVFVMSAKP
jgi:hypothetical protein